ncbi:MAG TPA: hypothetical protein VGL91_20900 [Acidobacteriota bacterium]|jgi:hypothetical protein
MLHKVISMLLIVTLLQMAAWPTVFAEQKEVASPEQIKASVVKLGVGVEARVTVKLRNNTKVKGFIYQSGENDFVVVDKTGEKRTIAYSDVARVEGKNLSTGTKVAIGVAIGVGIAIAAAAILAKALEGY